MSIAPSTLLHLGVQVGLARAMEQVAPASLRAEVRRQRCAIKELTATVERLVGQIGILASVPEIIQRLSLLHASLSLHKELDVFNGMHNHNLGEAIARAEPLLPKPLVKGIRSIKKGGDGARHEAFAEQGSRCPSDVHAVPVTVSEDLPIAVADGGGDVAFTDGDTCRDVLPTNGGGVDLTNGVSDSALDHVEAAVASTAIEADLSWPSSAYVGMPIRVWSKSQQQWCSDGTIATLDENGTISIIYNGGETQKSVFVG